MMLGLLFALLLTAVGAFAQEEEEESRPTFSVPEPAKKSKIPPGTPKGTYFITMVNYRLSNSQMDRFPRALAELSAYMSSSTDLKATMRWDERSLSDPRIMQSLFLYMTGNEAPLQIGSAEKKQLAEYLKNGGLLFGEDIRPNSEFGRLRGAGVSGTPFDRQFKALLKDPQVLASQGARWQKIRKDHALYSSYFDFPDGPPLGASRSGNVFDLEMLQIRGRVAVVFSDLNISWYWGTVEADSRQRGMQFGANLIVFALAQRATMGMGR